MGKNPDGSRYPVVDFGVHSLHGLQQRRHDLLRLNRRRQIDLHHRVGGGFADHRRKSATRLLVKLRAVNFVFTA